MGKKIKKILLLVGVILWLGYLFLPHIPSYDFPNMNEEATISMFSQYVKNSKIDDDSFIISNIEFKMIKNEDAFNNKHFDANNITPNILGYVKENGIKHFFIISPSSNNQFAHDVLVYITQFRKYTIKENIKALSQLQKLNRQGKIFIKKNTKE